MIKIKTKKVLRKEIAELEQKIKDIIEEERTAIQCRESMITDLMFSNSDYAEKNKKLVNKLERIETKLSLTNAVIDGLNEELNQREETIKKLRGRLGGITANKNKYQKKCESLEQFYVRKKPKATYENMKKYDLSPKRFAEDERKKNNE